MALGLTRPLDRNVYQAYFLGGKDGRCVGLSTLPPSCADCHELWEPQRSGTFRACTGIALPIFSTSFLGSVCVSSPKSFRGQRISGNVAMLPVHLIPCEQCPAVDCSQLNDVTVCLTHAHTRTHTRAHTHTHARARGIDNGALCQLNSRPAPGK